LFFEAFFAGGEVMYFRMLLERITPAMRYVARKHLLRGFYTEEDLYQEMCLYLWQNYKEGLPIGFNDAYVIKACEFHIQNFLRKGRPKAILSSLDMIISSKGYTLADILEDKKENISSSTETSLTIDELKNIGLSGKEQAVLSYLLKGYTVREIGKALDISHVMVMKHKKSMIKKWRKKGYRK
jgi:RNA polymerase sigma factor (sigma-70 family)